MAKSGCPAGVRDAYIVFGDPDMKFKPPGRGCERALTRWSRLCTQSRRPRDCSWSQRLSKSPHDLLKSGKVQRLWPIGQSPFRAGMDFDDETVGSYCHGRARDCRD
jgi:hypothetical protein